MYRSGERGDIRRKRQVSLHWAAKDGEKSQQGGKRGDQFLVAPSGVFSLSVMPDLNPVPLPQQSLIATNDVINLT